MATITRLRPQSAATLASELESFLTDLRDRRGLAENTIESYRYDLRTAAQFLDQPLETITTAQIETFLSSRQEKPSTTNRRLASLKRFSNGRSSADYVRTIRPNWSRRLKMRSGCRDPSGARISRPWTR